jgi:hypothetical protein
VPSIEMQKYLFLLCARQEKPAYEFVPYRFGCYSFQAAADKRTLTKYEVLSEHDNWALEGNTRFAHLLSSTDRKLVADLSEQVGGLRGDELVRHVYRLHPYYAINSEIRERLLSAKDRDKVEAAKPNESGTMLFTIGYEGKTLEGYLNRLIRANVRVLCDVRRNAISMKFGFNKRQLSSAVEKLGMRYIHMPELGIHSDKRRNLDSAAAREKLFAEYARTTLVDNADALSRVSRLVDDHSRVALTCFEAGHDDCHRGCVVEALASRPDFHHRVAHL